MARELRIGHSYDFTEEVRPLSQGNYELEKCFTEMLLGCVPDSYEPTSPVHAMCVGGDGSAKEGVVLKEFYEKRFGMSDVWVSCLDINSRGQMDDDNRGYDFLLSDPRGDARLPTAYLMSISEFNKKFNEKGGGIDHIHYNYPYPCPENLNAMISKSLEYLASNGILSVITSDFVTLDDIPVLNSLSQASAREEDLDVSAFQRYEIPGHSSLGIFGTFVAQKK